jgi:hypothetical protein
MFSTKKMPLFDLSKVKWRHSHFKKRKPLQAKAHNGFERIKKSTTGGTRTRTSVAAHRIFLPTTTLAACLPLANNLWSGLSLHLAPLMEFRCRLLSLYTFSEKKYSELGSGLLSASPVKASPNLSGSTLAVSNQALKFLMFLAR